MRNDHEEDFARSCSGRNDRRGFCDSRQCVDDHQADRRRGGYPQGGFGGGISVGVGVGVVDPGFSPGYYGGCYTTYRKVLIPNIGIVLKKQVVCG
jgi:hypothetical protein